MPSKMVWIVIALVLAMIVAVVLSSGFIGSSSSVKNFSELQTRFNSLCVNWQQSGCSPTSPVVYEITNLYKQMNNDDRAYIPIEELQRACNCYVSTSPTSGGYVAREFKDVPREESERKESSDTGTGVMVLIPPRTPSKGG